MKPERSQGTLRKILSFNVKTAPYYFLAPAVIIFAVFMIYPMIHSFVLSFQNFDGGKYEFIGFQNYIRLFKDPIFWNSIRNTLIYLVIQVPVMILMSLVLAVLIEQKYLRGRTFLRMSIFLPTITALVAYSIIFKLLFNTDYGFVNYLLSLFGIDKVDWLNTTWGARFTIILGITWRWTGYNMIIMIAGLKAIPEDIYESAELDGASSFEKFRYITLPMMKSIILFVSITSTIGTLHLFDESLILTNGGPDNATISIGHYLYNMGFRYFKFGYAAAISYVLVFIIALLSFIQFKVTEEDDTQ